ncbi:tetratricopeptide repeat protein [Empedobacter tilapiae]|uniref:Tetratricopeptide repeat protein n=1 Tax=Empedobacter tilapiae TaxID=2491114 RepID=A0A4Z1B600_9FLAO|nr:hypothetical protein [Empedobacter tilapiae]TGN26466.1 hypothetical protein E4J94_11625 [Empedobacter tilapiae]
MKTKILFLFLICLITQINAQSDFTKKFDFNSTTCKFPDNERAKKIFPLGIECIQNDVYLGSVAEIMTEMIKIDSTFCDAYYWAGYALRKSEMNKEAVAMYYMADSLAQNKSLEYKQNLATTSMIIGADDLARKKFEEIKEHFPNSPEGFYGVALTSTIMGDVDYGLENVNIAEQKYNQQNANTQLLKAILLTLNEKYDESLPYYEKIKNKYTKLDHFNGNYALSLFEIGTKNNDEKMLKLAYKHYNKVKNKDELTEIMRNKFEK